MKWSDLYSGAEMPSPEQIASFVAAPMWGELGAHLQSCYGVSPKVEYSTCSGAPGWNVKYRKGGRALCTLYPDEGFFTCLVTVGSREAEEVELLLPFFTEDIRRLYQNARPFNGARWRMIPVTSAQVLGDIKQLIAIRTHKKRS